MNRAALAVLAGAAIGFVVLLATSTGLRTVRGGRIGGDFPAFYAAGHAVASGRSAALYDPAAQDAAQANLFPEGTRGRIHFAYPPFVAAAYAPLAWLPFKTAYAVHVVVMALCLAWAIALCARAVPAVRGHEASAAAAALAFYPIFRATLGGQNTPLSLLCATGAAVSLAAGDGFRAGVWSGVWFFKPQLALPYAAALLLRRGARRRFAAGVALVCAIYYAAGAAIGGWAWPLWWWRDGVVPFAALDAVFDREHAISIPSLASAAGLRTATRIAAAAILGLVVLLARRRRLPVIAFAAFTAAAVVLAAPHALYYDGGLAILALLAAWGPTPGMRMAVCAAWALAWLQPFRDALPVPPLTVVLVLAMAMAATRRTSPAD